MANWIDGRTDILDRQVRPKVLITEEIVAVKVITVVVVEVGKQESASSFDLHAVLNKGWACSAPLLAGLANARRVECGSAGRRLLPERHIGCAPGLPSWPQSPPCRSRLHPSCVGQPCQKRSATCPALTQYCMYITQTALRTQIFVLHYAMHSTRWTDLHARH